MFASEINGVSIKQPINVPGGVPVLQADGKTAFWTPISNAKTIQTVRQNYTITPTDVSNEATIIGVQWTPTFVGTNYTVVGGITLVSGTGLPGGYFVNACYNKAFNSATFSVGCTAAVAGDVISLEAIAIADS